jgi:UDP-2-acetamido-3-amino-2,3-dideoxy-glucuronate N-acetyltransferase
MSYFVHPSSICESSDIGDGSRIWAFVHILPKVKIGKDCNICDFVFIEDEVSIGDRVTIKSGVQIWKGVTLMDDVFIGPNVSFTNDKYPKSRNGSFELKETTVFPGASIGANATILPGVRIGRESVVGAGSVVTHDVADFTVVIGNPARKVIS